MDLRTFISDVSRRRELARRLGRSPDYLYQIGVGFQGKRPSARLAMDIERETAAMGAKVPKASMRADIWGKK